MPPEFRAELIERLLDSFAATEEEVCEEWLEVAKQRLADLKSGKVTGVDGDSVLENAKSMLIQ